MKTIRQPASEPSKQTLAQRAEPSPAPSRNRTHNEAPNATTNPPARTSERSPPTFAKTKALWALARS